VQLVIDPADFRLLSAETQAELLRVLAGASPAATSGSSAPAAANGGQRGKAGFRWRVPYNVSTPLARKLVHGLADDALARLALFARGEGRVSMTELLAVTGDKDWHVLSNFIGVLTRKLRRLVGDDNRIISLIMWDFDAAVWDRDQKNLIDGVYYVSETTARALREALA
jgi:hypothetical protein